MKAPQQASVGDRRPIPAREWQISKRIARGMAASGISADAISLAGMFCGIAAGAALAVTSRHPSWERLAWVAAAALIQLRLLANMLDGMVAIESGRVSPVGQLYNEVPDRISDAATLIGLGYAAGGNVVLGYVAACVALLVAYVRAAGKVAGAHQEFCGPMAKQQRMFTTTLAALFCGLTPQTWWLDWPAEGFGLPAIALLLVIAGGVWTLLRRLRRIASALHKSAS